VPVVKDPSYGPEKATSARKRVPKVSIRRPLPKKEDALIALIASLIKNRKLTHLRIDHEEISYEYLDDEVAEEALKWLLSKE